MNIAHIAGNQLTLILRSRWLVSFGFLFMLLAFFVTYFSHSGGAGYDGFNRMTASLLNVTLLIIPLFALLMGALFLAGEKEDSGLLLLLTYPVSAWAVLSGKFIGMLVALGAVLTGGYGFAFLAAALLNSEVSVTVILKFYLLSFLLTAIFLAISVFIGIRAKSRFQALGVSLVVWACAVLFYEFLIMGISVFLANQSVIPLLSFSIFFNPVELIRVWLILSLDGGTVFGPSLYEFTVWAKGLQGMILFIVTSVLWIAVPLVAANISVGRGLEND